MRFVSAACLPLFLVTSLSCISVPDRPGTDKGGDDTSGGDSGPGDTDADTGTSTDSCSAEFTMAFPDGSSATLDFCQMYEMQAAFEFDPDEAPQIRSPTLMLHAVTDASFECWVEIIEPAICGEGYYRIDGSSGSVIFDTHDCSGVGNDFESVYQASTGYIEMETLYAGDEPGNFSGQPLPTTMAGSLSVSTDDGVVLSGSFSITRDVVADDAEEAGCAVSDGDDDDDGQNDAIFAGDDCNDADPTVYSGAPELCDGQVNDCGATLPADETDDDADGFVECTADLATWVGDAITGGDDCNDSDDTVYPGASELCDGQDNACTGSMPAEETDDDTDGFVECTIDSGGWDGASVSAGDDCNDADGTVYPGASELCDGQDNACTGSMPADETDDDADGYVECTVDSGGWDGTAVSGGEDCAPSDSTVYPGASEICDGQDNDCDGQTDEADAINTSTWYADLDSDGYGDSGDSTESCDAPTGYVTNDSDCNDADDTVYPGASELCDGADNDCDGYLDEPDAVDAPTWYADSDGDGYGSSNASQVACSAPGGYTSTGGDCDDLDAVVHPNAIEMCDGADNDCDGSLPADEADADSDGVSECEGDCDDSDAAVNPASTEVCDAVDNDCDGTVDEDDATDAQTWYQDSDADGYGTANSTAVSCSQPAGYSVLNTDCDDTNASANPGMTELCDGADNDCDGSLPADEADADSDGVSECEGDCDDSDPSVAQTCVPTDSGSSAPGISLNPDGTDTITLAGCGDFADITVDVDITATNSENLDISLFSPHGGGAYLWLGLAQSDGSANLQVTFGTSDPSHIAPFDPGNLGIFGTAGQWELAVIDFGGWGGGQPGTLNSWSINVTCN